MSNELFWENESATEEMSATEALIKIQSQFDQYKTFAKKLEQICESSQALAAKSQRESNAAMQIIYRIKEIISDTTKPIEDRYRSIEMLMAGINN